jgi:hypothetical protein
MVFSRNKQLVIKNWISDFISERIWRRWNWIFLASRYHKSFPAKALKLLRLFFPAKNAGFFIYPNIKL